MYGYNEVSVITRPSAVFCLDPGKVPFASLCYSVSGTVIFGNVTLFLKQKWGISSTRIPSENKLFTMLPITAKRMRIPVHNRHKFQFDKTKKPTVFILTSNWSSSRRLSTSSLMSCTYWGLLVIANRLAKTITCKYSNTLLLGCHRVLLASWNTI